jgi:hypothetical protein
VYIEASKSKKRKCFRLDLKELSREMDLAFDDMHGHWSLVSSRPK